MKVIQDIVDEALMVSVQDSIRQTGYVVNEKHAQTCLQQRLQIKYPDTTDEAIIKVYYGVTKTGKLPIVKRADLMVSGGVIVELKHSDDIKKIDHIQLQTYMALTRCKYGVMVAFPKTQHGPIKAEWYKEETNEFTKRTVIASKGVAPPPKDAAMLAVQLQYASSNLA